MLHSVGLGARPATVLATNARRDLLLHDYRMRNIHLLLMRHVFSTDLYSCPQTYTSLVLSAVRQTIDFLTQKHAVEDG